MERFGQAALKLLTPLLPPGAEMPALEIPPDRSKGDFALACFRLAKAFGKKPPEVPLALLSGLEKTPGAKRLGPDRVASAGLEFVAIGPYLNAVVPPEAAARTLLPEILAGEGLGSYGKLPENTRGKWVLEYSSPNVAKPFQIYHFRSTGLGAVLARAGRFRGFDTVSINHLGDWGTQYGKLSVAFRLFGDHLPAEPGIRDLVAIYVKFHEAAEKNPALEDEAREAFARLEKGDPAMTALWKKCVEISMREFNQLYARLGVKFDHVWGESHYKDQLEPLLADLRKRGLLVESEGAQVVHVTDAAGKELVPCILQKQDGSSIYATRDVAAALYRFDRFKFDRMTYIVGGEQKLHFQQVFGVLRKMGKKWVDACEHVATGLYRFQDAKMSTRKGNFVTFEDMLDLAREKVAEIVRARKDVPESELPAITEAVAIGAIVFHDLSSDPAHDVNFSIDRVVDFEGETGPYLQYAHTRCLSILRKAQGSGELPGGAPAWRDPMAEALSHPMEIALVKTLGRFPHALERTLAIAKASQLCHYLIEVTKDFGHFYRECHVLGQATDTTAARLALVEATRRVLGQGLRILGVPVPERM